MNQGLLLGQSGGQELQAGAPQEKACNIERSTVQKGGRTIPSRVGLGQHQGPKVTEAFEPLRVGGQK